MANNNGVSIYHTLSRWAWNNREGDEGGLPSYLEIGQAEDGWYYVIYPTDYQAYEQIPSARAEYDAMWKEMDEIRVMFNK